MLTGYPLNTESQKQPSPGGTVSGGPVTQAEIGNWPRTGSQHSRRAPQIPAPSCGNEATVLGSPGVTGKPALVSSEVSSVIPPAIASLAPQLRAVLFPQVTKNAHWRAIPTAMSSGPLREKMSAEQT